MPLSEVKNIDCMIAMRDYPDKFFDLAIVDPMYDMDEHYLAPGSEESNGVKRRFVQEAKALSKLPIVGMDYFNELTRVSRQQIIWGINYFEFAGEICGRIVWDKVNDESTFSNCELAACSLIQGVRIFRHRWNGFIQQNMKNKEARIHPFQKPVQLYKWILNKYSQPGWKILDTHLGSGSSRVACFDMNFDFTGFEIDLDHFEAQEKRFQQHIAQLKLAI